MGFENFESSGGNRNEETLAGSKNFNNILEVKGDTLRVRGSSTTYELKAPYTFTEDGNVFKIDTADNRITIKPQVSLNNTQEWVIEDLKGVRNIVAGASVERERAGVTMALDNTEKMEEDVSLPYEIGINNYREIAKSYFNNFGDSLSEEYKNILQQLIASLENPPVGKEERLALIENTDKFIRILENTFLENPDKIPAFAAQKEQLPYEIGIKNYREKANSYLTNYAEFFSQEGLEKLKIMISSLENPPIGKEDRKNLIVDADRLLRELEKDIFNLPYQTGIKNYREKAQMDLENFGDQFSNEGKKNLENLIATLENPPPSKKDRLTLILRADALLRRLEKERVFGDSSDKISEFAVKNEQLPYEIGIQNYRKISKTYLANYTDKFSESEKEDLKNIISMLDAPPVGKQERIKLIEDADRLVRKLEKKIYS